jgi:predicted XRE-type DNA-binding protein
MTSDTSLEGKVEMRVQRKLQDQVRNNIQKRKLSVQDIARELNLLPSGAQALLERQVWSIETTLRVAERLGLDVEIEVRSRK